MRASASASSGKLCYGVATTGAGPAPAPRETPSVISAPSLPHRSA
jgi:hypothetical protein